MNGVHFLLGSILGLLFGAHTIEYVNINQVEFKLTYVVGSMIFFSVAGAWVGSILT